MKIVRRVGLWSTELDLVMTIRPESDPRKKRQRYARIYIFAVGVNDNRGTR